MGPRSMTPRGKNLRKKILDRGGKAYREKKFQIANSQLEDKNTRPGWRSQADIAKTSNERKIRAPSTTKGEEKRGKERGGGTILPGAY